MSLQRMNVNLEYGRGYIELNRDIPGVCRILDKNTSSGLSHTDIIREALEQPVGSEKLRQLVSPTDTVCIVISDISRYYQRMDLFLPILVDELHQGGISDENITFLCALGAHGPQSDDEKKQILGSLAHRFSMIEHDCREEADLVPLGISPNGTTIALNRHAVECDKLILTGAIGYHDMAGYGGGRKSLIPGIASYEGVSKNHLQVFGKELGGGLNANCRLGNVAGNPMHEDMMAAGALLPPTFLFNVILDAQGEYYKAVAGDWQKAFELGMKYCDEACAVTIPEKADVVIAGCGGYPKDMNLYQASKGYAVALEAVKEGGTILLLAECEDSMGTEESVAIITDYEEQLDRELAMKREFVPEAYSGYYICEVSSRYELLLVSDYSDGGELAKSGVTLFRTAEEALDYIYANRGSETLTYVIPHSMSILPKLEVRGAGEGE